MNTIDFLQVITAEAKAAAAAASEYEIRKTECRARIFAVCDQIAQINLAAAAAGVLSAEQMAIYRAGLAWVDAMRTACAAGGDWPEVPAGVADLAGAF